MSEQQTTAEISSPSTATATTAVPERAASRTAEAVSIARAVHVTIDGEPRIHNDDLAPRFFSAATLASAAASDTDGTRLMRAHVLMRSRFAEDRAAAAVRERGCRNVVILGAGLDTYSLRRPSLPTDVRCWEIDHPASQRAKLVRLKSLNLGGSGDCTKFFTIDFALQTLRGSGLAEALTLSGPPNGPVVFISLGVIMYLSTADITALFAFTASFPKGSELIVSYVPDAESFTTKVEFSATPHLPPLTAAAVLVKDAGAEAVAAALGEPWLSKHSEESLTALLRAAGFSTVEPLSLEKAATYFGPLPRADKLVLSTHVSVLAAVV